MAIKKCDGGWLVDIQPGGRGAKRIRKTLNTKAEAIQFEAWATSQAATTAAWEMPKRDFRKLRDLIETWQSHHGVNLRHRSTYPTLIRMCEALGNPTAESLKTEQFAAYRTTRLSQGITPNTVNREHAYMRAMFNELIRLGSWTGDNPLAKIRQFKIPERELSFLTNDQITALLQALGQRKDHDALLITKICLSTGARWDEAESLKLTQLHSGMVHYTQTKTDRNRSVPIEDALANEIRDFYEFRAGEAYDRIFKSSVGAFRMAVKDAKIDLLDGQLTHVLRHTFASHFVMGGGNILVLQKVLGHKDLKTTMIYAHLAPGHLGEVKHLNPLAVNKLSTLQLSHQGSVVTSTAISH
jgi:site-specific recombinase XerD